MSAAATSRHARSTVPPCGLWAALRKQAVCIVSWRGRRVRCSSKCEGCLPGGARGACCWYRPLAGQPQHTWWRLQHRAAGACLPRGSAGVGCLDGVGFGAWDIRPAGAVAGLEAVCTGQWSSAQQQRQRVQGREHAKAAVHPLLEAHGQPGAGALWSLPLARATALACQQHEGVLARAVVASRWRRPRKLRCCSL